MNLLIDHITRDIDFTLDLCIFLTDVRCVRAQLIPLPYTARPHTHPIAHKAGSHSGRATPLPW